MAMKKHWDTEAGAMKNEDDFPKTSAYGYGCIRTDGTIISDISDSACSEMMERNDRNQDIIESPPAFLMNDTGPPSVIYNGVLENSMSFFTTYSAAATEVRTVTTKVNDASMDLSVVHELREAGVEIDYEDASFSASSIIKNEYNDVELAEAESGLGIECAHGSFARSTASKHSEIELAENDGLYANIEATSCQDNERNLASSSKVSEMNTDNEFQTSTPVINPTTKTGEVNSGVAKTAKSFRENWCRSNTLKLGNMDFFRPIIDGRFQKDEINDTENSTRDNRLCAYDVDTSKGFEIENSSSNDDDEYGFEITHVAQPPNNSNTDFAATVLAPSLDCAVEVASDSVHTSNQHISDKKDTNDASPDDGLSHDDNTINRITSETNVMGSNEWDMKPDLSLEDDDASIIGALSFITVETKDLTDVSNDSMIKDELPSAPKTVYTGLFAKLFGCGTTTVGCGEVHECEDDFDRTSRMLEEEKVEKLTRGYEASVQRRGIADQQNIESGGTCNNKTTVNPVVNSTVVARTKLYPGVEVSSNQGTDRVSKNSKSRAIKDMIKTLKRKKVWNKKQRKRSQSKGKCMSNSSERKTKRSILERINVQVV